MAETTQSSFLSPQAVSMLVQLGPAALQFFEGQSQIRKGKEMQSKLGPRVDYSIPGAATKALNVAERLAAPYEMPGAGSRRYLQDMQNQKFLSGALQAGNTQDAMSLLTQGLEQAQLGELEFSNQSAQNYAQRQLARQSALGTYAGYQDALTADRQKDFYERSKATTDMLTAGKTNRMGALQGLANTALMAMMYGKGNLGQTGDQQLSTRADYINAVDQSQARMGLFKNLFRPLGSLNEPSSDVSSASPSMPQASQGAYTPSFSFERRIGKNPSMWDEYQPLVPGFRNIGLGSNRFNDIGNLDLFNPIYK
jgi:hypothetical protein